MNGTLWWDIDNDGSFVNSILKFSDESYRWFLKNDIKDRLKNYILNPTDFEEIINLWKRLQSVKNDLGEELGINIIREAVNEIQDEFNEPEWEQEVFEKIQNSKKVLNDDFYFLH